MSCWIRRINDFKKTTQKLEKKIQTIKQFAQSNNIVIQLYHAQIKTPKKNIFVVQLHLQTRGFSNMTAASSGLPLSSKLHQHIHNADIAFHKQDYS